jgi:hypothetical protein
LGADFAQADIPMIWLPRPVLDDERLADRLDTCCTAS